MGMKLQYIIVGMWLAVFMMAFYVAWETELWVIEIGIPQVPLAWFIIPILMIVGFIGMSLSLVNLSEMTHQLVGKI